ncbi:FAD-dependent oxidoreductase [Paenibacillus polymyxa]|uniref:FAD-dependent oxidoreductase n=1 Tax=Paenibacillus polymyxa TaxID=1406 RepID=UPI00058A50BE|nr:FAD-dependent oxidoreductase [Paenibacillus polymyxa]AJE51782.1 (2Fe-2S)-binding protein [Paenibacillus polymyxa]QOH64404.1 FAD-dependent oxidoreductase [Paenibacillus polymyxa]
MKQDECRTTFPQFPESYWLASTDVPNFPKLNEDIQVDVAIVGAGITGITTAYLLSKKGLNVAVVDAGRILHGTTGHTTAKITAQHDLIYSEFLSHFGKEKTRLYYEANREALEFIRQTVEEYHIDCQFTEEDAYVYTCADTHVEKINDEYKAYKELGIPGSYVEQTPLPFSTKAAIMMENQAQFNPIPFLRYLANQVIRQGGKIYEQTTVVGVDKGTPSIINTSDGHKITCNYVVSSSHFPFNDPNSLYFARLHAERSYVLAVKTDKTYPGGMYISAETPKRSLRSVLINGEPMVIVGGEGHKTGQGICTFQYYEALEKFAEQTFGLKEIVYRWSAQDLYSLDKLPYIGQELSDVSNIFVATGYRKWGMTTSVAAALLNTNLITRKESPYQDLFSPSRFHADPDIKTFVTQNANVAKHLIAGKLEISYKKAEELQQDEGAVVRVNGKRAGAYRDPQGALHLVDTTCTHMGCEVDWNEAERTWDCPCHGSRFSYQGEVIEGPAKKSLSKVEVGKSPT